MLQYKQQVKPGDEMSNLRLIDDTTRPLVRVCDVKKSYAMGSNVVNALQGISFEVQPGELVALCGSSGSGKTTLLNLIGCLDVVGAGEIHIGDKDVGKMSDREVAQFRAERLGFIFQTFNLLPVLTTLENVEYPLLKLKLSKSERRERATAALKQVGLDHHHDHRPDQLSGGQRQRVAIARAIVARPELVVADEPTANLDKKTANEILDLLCDLNKRLGVTVIVATHDPYVMRRMKRLVSISDGRLIEGLPEGASIPERRLKVSAR